MPELGRNYPCPCGSGKKYKNCCMRQDRLRAARMTTLAEMELATLIELAEYVAQPRFAKDLEEGIALFWSGRYEDEAFSAMNDDERQRFIEWFAHDYRYGEEQRHIIDLLIERKGPQYPPEARQLLEAWSRSVMTMLRYVQRGGDDRLLVYDPLREAEYEIVSRLMATNARPGDVLVGRVYEMEGAHYLSTTSLLLPEQHEQPLADYVRNAYRLYCDEHPGASWERFLRTHGYILYTFLLTDRARALRSLIGPGTRFYDPAITRDRMREIDRQVRQQEEARELMTIEDLEPLLDMRHTAGGIVLPGYEEPEEEPSAQGEPTERPTILIPGRDD